MTILDGGNGAGDLAGDVFTSAPFRLVVEQDAVAAVQVVGLTVIAHQVVACQLGNAVGRARVKGGGFILRRDRRITKHLGRAGKIQPAVWHQVFERRQQVVGAVDVGGECRELVLERIADETLGCQMVALVWLHLAHNAVHAGIRIDGAGVQRHPVENVGNICQPAYRVLEFYLPHDTVHGIPLREQEFR